MKITELTPGQYRQYLDLLEYSPESARRYYDLITSEKYRRMPYKERKTLSFYSNKDLEGIIEKYELKQIQAAEELKQ